MERIFIAAIMYVLTGINLLHASSTTLNVTMNIKSMTCSSLIYKKCYNWRSTELQDMLLFFFYDSMAHHVLFIN